MKSSQTHRAQGAMKNIGGKIKKGIGRAIGNEQMEAEGQAKETEGYVEKEAAKATERVKGAAHELEGKVRRNLNKPS